MERFKTNVLSVGFNVSSLKKIRQPGLIPAVLFTFTIKKHSSSKSFITLGPRQHDCMLCGMRKVPMQNACLFFASAF
jgi:hypothetical protein